MTFDPNAVSRYTIEDVGLWSWSDDDEGTHVGYIADEEEGTSMGLAFVRFRAGAVFDFTWPYDEVSVVTRGSLTIRSGGERITAQQGEILNQPKGVPGRFEIDEDMEMICVHYPTFAKGFGMTLSEYKRLTDAGEEPSEPAPPPRGPAHAGGHFDPTVMQAFSIADVPRWLEVDPEQAAHVGYLADQAEGSPVGLAFSDFRRGGSFEFSFPYDEVAAVTKGGFTVRTKDHSFTVRAGEMLYMPANTSAVFEIEEDTVSVGIHHPTVQEATGKPPHQL